MLSCVLKLVLITNEGWTLSSMFVDILYLNLLWTVCPSPVGHGFLRRSIRGILMLGEGISLWRQSSWEWTFIDIYSVVWGGPGQFDFRSCLPWGKDSIFHWQGGDIFRLASGVPWLYSLGALICPVYLLWFSSPYLVPLSDGLPSHLSSYSRSADFETSSYRNWVLSVLCCVCTHPLALACTCASIAFVDFQEWLGNSVQDWCEPPQV